MIELDDSTALVTGAGRGIGEATAVRFAEAGANVVAAARTEAEIEATVDRVEAAGSEGLAVSADVSDIDEIEALLSTATDRFGVPDVLVNNAGVFLAASPLEQSLEDVDRMFDLNLRGLFVLCQRWGKAFLASPLERGRVINVASNVATVSVPQWTAYMATKTGVLGITRGLARELASEGVTVNAVSPGTTRTPAVERAIEEMGDELYDFDELPMGRIGKPEDVADVCLFLASDLSRYVTGEEIRVDGGVSITSGFYR